MIKVSLAITVVLIAAFLAACSAQQPGSLPKTGAEPAQPGGASVGETTGKKTWQQEWDNIVQGAKKEQRVVVFGLPGGETTRLINEGFKNKYGIVVEAITGRGSEVAEKLVTQHRAGLYLADVFLGGSETSVIRAKPAGVLAPVEPVFILPEVTDSKVWYRGELPFLDRGRYLIPFLAYPSIPLTINTTMVKAEEVKSFRDLLNPKWKGKMILNDPLVPGSGSKWFEIMGSELLGWDYLKELVKQDLFVLQDQRQQVEWVARGKAAIAIAPFSPAVIEFRTAGAPIIELTPVEGTHSTGGQSITGLINKAAHPDAARLFINWLFSKEGQTIASRAYGRQSARVDVPTDHLDSMSLRNPSVKYFNGDDEDWLVKQPERIKIVREIFASLPK